MDADRLQIMLPDRGEGDVVIGRKPDLCPVGRMDREGGNAVSDDGLNEGDILHAEHGEFA
jgi:hypothetical protein